MFFTGEEKSPQNGLEPLQTPVRRDQFNFLFYDPAELDFSKFEKKKKKKRPATWNW